MISDEEAAEIREQHIAGPYPCEHGMQDAYDPLLKLIEYQDAKLAELKDVQIEYAEDINCTGWLGKKLNSARNRIWTLETCLAEKDARVTELQAALDTYRELNLQLRDEVGHWKLEADEDYQQMKGAL